MGEHHLIIEGGCSSLLLAFIIFYENFYKGSQGNNEKILSFATWLERSQLDSAPIPRKIDGPGSSAAPTEPPVPWNNEEYP